jgi:hypothetical protein
MEGEVEKLTKLWLLVLVITLVLLGVRGLLGFVI